VPSSVSAQPFTLPVNITVALPSGESMAGFLSSLPLATRQALEESPAALRALLAFSISEWRGGPTQGCCQQELAAAADGLTCVD